MNVALPTLNRRFRASGDFRARAGTTYSLLPLRFIPLSGTRQALTNFTGEHVVVEREELEALVRHELDPGSPLYEELKARHFLMDGDSTVALDLLATQYRTRQGFLESFTSLFMFVVTLRCEHSCPYCQVSRQTEDREAFDMTQATADRAIDFMLRGPSRHIKVEFQGGESFLNFPLIRYIVERVEGLTAGNDRAVSFVVATNLAVVTDEMLDFCRDHRVAISTSLDGPPELHNANRPRPGGDSHQRAVAGIQRAREVLGFDQVSALMTTTQASLAHPEAIVDAYVDLGFDSIFLRWMSPYGFAVKTRQVQRYGTDEWLAFYKRALRHVIDLSLSGVRIREEYAALILRRILTPFATGYVDLQSPAGLGISCLLFNYDGGIYASDESRMLAEMGDTRFRLGDLGTDSYEQVMTSPGLVELIRDTMTEGTPMCCDCGFQPYCGSDPLYHHATQGDAVGFKPSSGFCRRNMEIMRHLILLLEDDRDAARVLRGWAAT